MSCGRPQELHVIDGTLMCRRCSTVKSVDDFHRASKRPTGRQYNCKQCENELKLLRYHAKLASDLSYKEQKATYDRQRRIEKGEELRAYDRARHKTDHRRQQMKARGRVRKAGIGFATPKWLTARQRKQTRQIYKLAEKFQKVFRREYHVDHIVPLRGKNVCGLHVPWNLRVMERSMNQRRSNKFDGG